MAAGTLARALPFFLIMKTRVSIPDSSENMEKPGRSFLAPDFYSSVIRIFDNLFLTLTGQNSEKNNCFFLFDDIKTHAATTCRHDHI